MSDVKIRRERIDKLKKQRAKRYLLSHLAPISPKSRTPSYVDLYGQSVLRNTSQKLLFLDQLARELVEFSGIPGGPFVAAKPKEKFRTSHDLIIDICEKLGFLWLASKEIERLQSKCELIDGSNWYYLECSRVKYHLYSCIFNSKAVSDSVSVLLNSLFRLGYVAGEVDFIKERKFRRDLIKKSENLDELWKSHAAWFINLGSFRDALIHRQSFPVFIRYPETKVVFDLQYVGVEVIDGKETIYYDLTGGPTGVLPARIFKFRGSEFVAQWKPVYVMPIDIVNFTRLSSKKKFNFDDFQDAKDFCRVAFDRLRELSEIAFKETLQEITRTNR
jgi:hypothetical protein